MPKQPDFDMQNPVAHHWQDAIAYACAQQRLEGQEVSTEAIRAMEKVARGEISYDECRAEIIAFHTS